MDNLTLKNNQPTQWIMWGIPFIFFLGSILHFVYDWSGNNAFVGIFAPVNESVWEHLKLTFWPTLLWWLWGYYRFAKRVIFSLKQWLFPGLISLVAAPIFIVSFYYTYTGAFGIHSLFLDILSLLIGIIIAQLVALHFYRHSALNACNLYLALAILVLLIAIFIIFTFSPPHIPLFRDSRTGLYGI